MLTDAAQSPIGQSIKQLYFRKHQITASSVSKHFEQIMALTASKVQE